MMQDDPRCCPFYSRRAERVYEKSRTIYYNLPLGDGTPRSTNGYESIVELVNMTTGIKIYKRSPVMNTWRDAFYWENPYERRPD